MDNNGLMHAFTASEVAAVETRLWGLLQRQVQHYTICWSRGCKGRKTARRSCCMEIWMKWYSVGWNG